MFVDLNDLSYYKVREIHRVINLLLYFLRYNNIKFTDLLIYIKH